MPYLEDRWCSPEQRRPHPTTRSSIHQLYFPHTSSSTSIAPSVSSFCGHPSTHAAILRPLSSFFNPYSIFHIHLPPHPLSPSPTPLTFPLLQAKLFNPHPILHGWLRYTMTSPSFQTPHPAIDPKMISPCSPPHCTLSVRCFFWCSIQNPFARLTRRSSAVALLAANGLCGHLLWRMALSRTKAALPRNTPTEDLKPKAAWYRDSKGQLL